MSEHRGGKPEAGHEAPKKEAVVLTPEQDTRLMGILLDAKAAEKAGNLKLALELYTQYKQEFLAIKNKTPEAGISPEQMAVLAEIFKGEALDQITLPKPEELTDAYFDKMYPAEQTEADTARGLVSFHPSHWDEKMSKYVDLGPDKNETCGQAYIRSIQEEAAQLQGKTLLTESIQKPNYTGGSQQYGTKEGIDASKDPLLPLIREVFGDNTSRFNLTWDQITAELIPRVKEKILAQFKAKKMSLPPHFDVIITPALASNIQMTNNRPENSQTNTYEWTSTPLLKQDKTNSGHRLMAGDSDDGGAGSVSDDDRGDRWLDRGFRLSVVLGK